MSPSAGGSVLFGAKEIHPLPSYLWKVPPGKPSHSLCELPSRLQEAVSRRVVTGVLRQIKERFPDDFARLKDRVVMIRALSRDEFDSGTRGWWHGRKVWALYRDVDPFTLSEEIRLNWDETACGIVELPECSWVTEDGLAANAAHEFGHACTLNEDVEKRQAPLEEWGREAAADWYAYRWGFGRLIGKTRRTRELGHHGAGPGQTVELEFDGRRIAYRLGRDFVYRGVE